MSVDSELERLLDEFDQLTRRRDTRVPLIREALAELPSVSEVKLENYMGYGRNLPINDEVREALINAGEEEIASLQNQVEDARERIMSRRSALAGLPQA